MKLFSVHPMKRRAFVEAMEYKVDTFEPAEMPTRLTKEMETLKLKSWESPPKNFTGLVEYEYKDKYWYKNGELHREDGPAIEKTNGFKAWYKNGLGHREDGPAEIYPNGTEKWWIEDEYYTEEEFKEEIERRNQKNINSETNIKTEIAAPLTASAASLKSEGTPASEEKKMTKSTKEKVFEIAKSDAVEVAKRVAVQQISNTIQDLLIELISSGKKGKQKTALKSNLEEFFSSEAGRAMVKFASGLMLPQLATYAEKYGMLKPQHVMIVQVLSEEMRIQGETDATLHVIDMVTPMLSMLTSGLTSQFGSLFSSFEENVEPVRVALDSGVELNSTHEETVGSSAVALKTAMG